MNSKNKQLGGSTNRFKIGRQNATATLLQSSPAFSILFYLALTQTVALIASQHSAFNRISPLQAAFEYNYRTNARLLKQTADAGVQLGTTLLTEIPPLAVKLEQPVAKSNPLFLILKTGFSLPPQEQTAHLQNPPQPAQDTIEVATAEVATAKIYPPKPHRYEPQDDFETNTRTTAEGDAELAKQSIVKPELPGNIEKSINTVKPDDDASSDDEIPDIDTLIASKSFVSAIKDSGSKDYTFDFYELAMKMPFLAADFDTNGKSAILEPVLALQSNSDDASSLDVYERNLPGLLAYEIVQPIVVVIDAGHGGVDPGTIGEQGLLEKDLTLDMARRLQTLATLHSDIEIVLSRDDSDGLSRAERVASVKAVEADLLISLHFNSLPEGDITLVETYYTDARLAARFVSTSNKQAPPAAVLPADTPTLSAKKPTNISHVSRNLARHLQAGVFSAVQNRNPLAIDAGVKQEGLFLLAQSGIPGALVELTCLSNEQEEDRLRTEPYRNELAHALMNAVRKFVDSETLASSI